MGKLAGLEVGTFCSCLVAEGGWGCGYFSICPLSFGALRLELHPTLWLGSAAEACATSWYHILQYQVLSFQHIKINCFKIKSSLNPLEIPSILVKKNKQQN